MTTSDNVGSEAWLTSVWGSTLGWAPPQLSQESSLDAVGLVGLDRMLVVSSVERSAGIEFPEELVNELRTVGDLLYYVNTVSSHGTSGGR